MQRLAFTARPDVDASALRDALDAWASARRAVVRLDRPLRDPPGGRHFHVAAPAVGTGTLEVNLEPDVGQDHSRPTVALIVRDHWAGTWAGGAAIDLIEWLGADLGG